MNDPGNGGICRVTASVASLAGTQTGHLMCDLPATHVEKTPGQIAYETYFANLADIPPDWGRILEDACMRWEAAARAVLAAQHYDDADQITWTRGKVPGNGQPG